MSGYGNRKTQNKMQNYIKIAKKNKVVNLLGTGEKQWDCEFLPYNLS